MSDLDCCCPPVTSRGCYQLRHPRAAGEPAYDDHDLDVDERCACSCHDEEEDSFDSDFEDSFEEQAAQP